MLSVSVNQQKLAEADRSLASVPKGYPKAISRALNKTIATANSRLKKALTPIIRSRGATTATQRDVGRAIRFTRASQRKHESRLVLRGGVRRLVPQGEEFIARMPSGHTSIFRREAPRKGLANYRPTSARGRKLQGLPIYDMRPKTKGANLLTRMLGDSEILFHLDAAAADAGKLLERNFDTQVKGLLEGTIK